MSRWRAFLRGTASLLDLQGALARRPALSDLRREFPDWDITGTRREGFTARRPGVVLPAMTLEQTAARTKHDPDTKGDER